MKQSCYLETSVIGYLTSWPSRDLVVAGHQQITHDWWEKRRNHFDVYISQVVLDEVSRGDQVAVRERLEVVRGVPLLDVSDLAAQLSDKIIKALSLPQRAAADAAHIAIAASNGIDFLLTWNCRHIANAELQPLIRSACYSEGLEPPIICTPEELLTEPPNVR
jgi:predicted nucleic acid-binding protein